MPYLSAAAIISGSRFRHNRNPPPTQMPAADFVGLNDQARSLWRERLRYGAGVSCGQLHVAR
jgi:hypothetical protein